MLASRHALLLYTSLAALQTRRYAALAPHGVTPVPHSVHKEGVVAKQKMPYAIKREFGKEASFPEKQKPQYAIKKESETCVFSSAKVSHEHDRSYPTRSRTHSDAQT